LHWNVLAFGVIMYRFRWLLTFLWNLLLQSSRYKWGKLGNIIDRIGQLAVNYVEEECYRPHCGRTWSRKCNL